MPDSDSKKGRWTFVQVSLGSTIRRTESVSCLPNENPMWHQDVIMPIPEHAGSMQHPDDMVHIHVYDEVVCHRSSNLRCDPYGLLTCASTSPCIVRIS